MFNMQHLHLPQPHDLRLYRCLPCHRPCLACSYEHDRLLIIRDRSFHAPVGARGEAPRRHAQRAARGTLFMLQVLLWRASAPAFMRGER